MTHEIANYAFHHENGKRRRFIEIKCYCTRRESRVTEKAIYFYVSQLLMYRIYSLWPHHAFSIESSSIFIRHFYLNFTSSLSRDDMKLKWFENVVEMFEISNFKIISIEIECKFKKIMTYDVLFPNQIFY